MVQFTRLTTTNVKGSCHLRLLLHTAGPFEGNLVALLMLEHYFFDVFELMALFPGLSDLKGNVMKRL